MNQGNEATRLKDWLAERGTSQETLARAIDYTATHVNRILNAHTPMSSDFLIRVEQAYPATWQVLNDKVVAVNGLLVEPLCPGAALVQDDKTNERLAVTFYYCAHCRDANDGRGDCKHKFAVNQVAPLEGSDGK